MMFPQKNIARDHWGFLLLCFSTFIAAGYGNCGAPLRLDFAIVESQFSGQDNFSVGANVSYSCIPGYIRVPGSKNVIYCLDNSTWSTPEVFCQRRSCPYPGDTLNGDVHIDNLLFGSRVNYTCHTGYNMISKKNYRDCQADGSWSNEVPECQVQICAAPDAITNGTFDPVNEEYEYQNAVTYQCNDKKFALIGQNTVFCTAYGNWSSDAPKCVAVECSTPDVANAKKLSGFAGPYYFDSAVTFECLPGFIMKGANLVKCNTSSQWNPPLPTCYILGCVPPYAIANGSYSPAKEHYAYQDIVTYQCNEKKFALLGQPTVSCTSFGNWSSDAPKCVVPSCAPPYAITDGSFSPVKEDYVYQDNVTYQCNEKKFALIGQPTVSCTSFGNWSSDAPKCVAVECPNPDVANANKLSALNSPYYFNSAVTFECFPGFTMKGSNVVKCNASSQWDPPLPTCSSSNVAAIMGNTILILTMILMGVVTSEM